MLISQHIPLALAEMFDVCLRSHKAAWRTEHKVPGLRHPLRADTGTVCKILTSKTACSPPWLCQVSSSQASFYGSILLCRKIPTKQMTNPFLVQKSKLKRTHFFLFFFSFSLTLGANSLWTRICFFGMLVCFADILFVSEGLTVVPSWFWLWLWWFTYPLRLAVSLERQQS